MRVDTGFKAAILHRQNEPLAVQKIHMTTDLKPGQVLVKLRCSGICGSQLGEISGKKGPDPYLPHLLGHEGCADVLATGPGVTRTKTNDKVVLHWMKASGIQAETPTYISSDDQKVNAGYVTTFNEYAIVSENRLTPIPKDFPDEMAALMGCAITTGFGIVQHELRPQLGASMLVIGAGGIGLSIIASAALLGSVPLIALDQHADRLGIAKQVGADHTINTSSINDSTPAHTSDNRALKDAILSIVGSEGVDYVAECTGNTALIELAFDITHPKGTCLLAGVPPSNQPPRFKGLELLLGKKLLGSCGGNTLPDEDIPRYIKLIESEKIQLTPLLGEKILLDDINQGLTRMREGQTTGRTLIDFR